MEAFFPQDIIHPAVWLCLSLLLSTAVFFRFSRLWLVRNFDLILLLGFSPALLLPTKQAGFANAWLFGLSGLLLLRMCLDGLFARRPMFEQNLNSQGMAFLAVCALLLLTLRVVTLPLSSETRKTVERSEQLLAGEASSQPQTASGPTTSVLTASLTAVSGVVVSEAEVATSPLAKGAEGHNRRVVIVVRVLAVMAHLGVVLGLVLLGSRVFGELHLGLSMATFYLLLPCTYLQAGELIHVLPSALLVWAAVCWKRPVLSGGFLGLACGTLFFPVFVVPVWASFYGGQRAKRFLLAFAVAGAVLIGSFALTSAGAQSFTRQAFGAIDWSWLSFRSSTAAGFWTADNAAFRIPILVAFFLLIVVLTFWPRRKSLEHVLAGSTAIIVATQFWYPQAGGLYLLWYLPLTLTVVFRPRLAHLRFETPAQPAAKPTVSQPAGRQLVMTAAAGTSLFR